MLFSDFLIIKHIVIKRYVLFMAAKNPVFMRVFA